MIGDVAAALDLEDRDVAGASRFSPCALRPERDDVRVLDEDERVRDLVALARRHQLALQRPDLAELAGAEIDDARGIDGGFASASIELASRALGVAHRF